MREAPSPTLRSTVPYLEHCLGNGRNHRFLLDRLPFRIGRSSTAHLVIPSTQVSKEHAEIILAGGEYVLRDLDSRNGTFVNGERILEASLRNGDILGFATEECRFVHEIAEAPEIPSAPMTELFQGPRPTGLLRGADLIRDMIERQNLRVIFHPIVALDTRQPVGYEALGRGTHPQLSPKPAELFHLATQCGLAGELSRHFRAAAVRAAGSLPDRTRLFLNLHPAEMADPDLVDSLANLQRQVGGRHPLVIEVHEDAVTNLPALRQLHDRLRALGMELAYDDFGAGQSRLMELAEVAPRFIKLDMRLIRGIDVSPPRQEVVQAILRVTAGLGVLVIAEGIETRAEAETCRKLGCFLGQGYLFGHPGAADSLGEIQLDTKRMDLSVLRRRLQDREAKTTS